MNPDIRLLEIGFGKGLILDKLARKGFECYGVDITLEGLKHNPNIHDGITFREAYAWNLPFGNDQFDIVYSTDVLEHIPPLYVGETIKELKRVSKNLNVHCIATVPDSKRFGYDCHLSVLPIEVWQKHFWGVNNYIFEREF